MSRFTVTVRFRHGGDDFTVEHDSLEDADKDFDAIADAMENPTDGDVLVLVNQDEWRYALRPSEIVAVELER